MVVEAGAVVVVVDGGVDVVVVSSAAPLEQAAKTRTAIVSRFIYRMALR